MESCFHEIADLGTNRKGLKKDSDRDVYCEYWEIFQNSYHAENLLFFRTAIMQKFYYTTLPWRIFENALKFVKFSKYNIPYL